MTGKRSGNGSDGFSGGGLGGMAYLPEFNAPSITQNTPRWPRAAFWQGPFFAYCRANAENVTKHPPCWPLRAQPSSKAGAGQHQPEAF